MSAANVYGVMAEPLQPAGIFPPPMATMPHDTRSESNLTFGTALSALKQGKRVTRQGWNGKGMWLAMSGRLQGTPVEAGQFWSHHNRDFAAMQESGHAVVLPCITMKTADGKILMGWLASSTDMLAEDWMVL